MPILVQLLIPAVGCAPAVHIQHDPAYVPRSTPPTYDDSAWETVLKECVHGGLVDYKRLAADPTSLEKYLGLISVIGPESTPDIFPTPSDRMCYYINAYNACGLRIVLRYYPVPSVHHMPFVTGFAHKHAMRVDGQNLTLTQLRSRLEEASRGDVRVSFCLSEASVGSPVLADEPYRAETLQRQLKLAVDRALANPRLFRVDHDSKTVYIWLRMFQQKQRFLDYYERTFGQRTTSLLPLLLRWSGPEIRRKFAAAQGYEEKIMPHHRGLNDYKRVSS